VLHFLSTLFTQAQKPGAEYDPALLEAAIERVVDGTDRRLRGFGSYRKRLQRAVEAAVVHVIGLVERLPASTEISRRAYGSDPRLRAFFVSPADLQEKIGGFRAVGDFIKDAGGPLPDEIFGVLSMEWEQRNVLGMQLQGDTVQRDVPKVVVNFFNHRYFGPAGTEAESRWLVKVRAFDYLIEKALERIVSARGRRRELESQHALLQRKLAVMRQGNWGLESMLAPSEHATPPLAELEAEIDAVEAELAGLGSRPGELEQTFAYITETLEQAADWIELRTTRLGLDSMSVKSESGAAAGASELELCELFSVRGDSRILLTGRFPRAELPARPDFFREAGRYLG
jgi:hypothetical protein